MLNTRNLCAEELAKINSMTKYPSIPTYHKLGERGALTEEAQVPFFALDNIIGTEKIDGVNARICVMPDGGYFIGSREELLYASGDLLENPALSIVKVLRPVAEYIVNRRFLSDDRIGVFFFEVYGGNVTAASKNYTSTKEFAFRLFDFAKLDCVTYSQLLGLSLGQVASWRDGGGQYYDDEFNLDMLAEVLGLPLTPRVVVGCPPTGVNETYDWLQGSIQKSHAILDVDAFAEPEGLVIRTPCRMKIAKIRFEDYRKTLQIKKGK